MHSCTEAGAWTTRLPGPWGAVVKGVAEVFWLWHILGSQAAGVGMAGWGGSLHNDSLALSRNAGEPEAGVGGNREDVEDAGALSWVPFSRGGREVLI